MATGDAAKLASVNVTFHTNDNDKDDDTTVDVTVQLIDGTIIASISDDFGHFDDHSNSGPFDVPLMTRPTRGDLKKGNVTVKVEPNGDDTWHLNFFVDMVFEDGAHLFARANGLELSESQTEQSFGIE